MAMPSSLSRRGAVYHWRRRLPAQIAEHTNCTYLKISLQVREYPAARFLAASLTAYAEELFLSSPPLISAEQLKQLFAAKLSEHSDKLRIARLSAERNPGFNSDHSAREDLAFGQAFRIIAQRGLGARLMPQDRERLMEQGLDIAQIEDVEQALHEIKRNGFDKPSLAKIEALLKGVGAEISLQNIRLTEPVYFHALAEANLQNGKQTAFDPDAVLVKPQELASASDRNLAAPVPVHASSPSTTEQDNKDKPEQALPILAVGTLLAERKFRDGSITEKTKRQMMSIFDLLARFMLESYSVDDAHQVKQVHFAALSDLFDQLPKSYGKSPSDKIKSIVQLREKGQEVGNEKSGLDPGTRNRHLTYLGQWLNEATARGASNCRDIKLTPFRSRRKGRPRDDRPTPGLEAITKFFLGPPFVGCLNGDSPCEQGSEVFHRAAYFAPLMFTYMGLRREEACGLSVDDVKFTDSIAHVDIKFSEIRRIKNASSVRFLAVHPELLRLGLMDYVEAVRALGYETLFPDLRGSGSNVPMGDRLYDELKLLIDETGAGLHAQRHFFGGSLKAKRVSLEERRDLLGHVGRSETDERYCSGTELERQLELIRKLPIVTGHLQPRPIRLLDWVIRCEVPPWKRKASGTDQID